MSVINRMLRDLDQRKQQERKGNLTPAAAAPGGFPWAWLLGIFVVVAISVVAFMAIYDSMSGSEPDLRVQSTPAPIKGAEQEPTSLAAAPETAAAEQQSTPAPEAVQPQRQLMPAPVNAQTGSNLATESEPQQSQPEQLTRPQQTPGPEQQSGAGQKMTTEPQSGDAGGEAVDASSGTMKVTRVELSAEELAEVKLNQAREALQNGERQRAGSLLEQVIALAPEHVDARSELAAYWYGRGRVASAVAVLEEGIQRQPLQTRWQILYARIMLESGSYGKLLSVLSEIPANTPETSDLLQMRATAASELGRYGEAAADYQRLAERTQEGRWWLAAAVAYEDAEQPKAALNSYQHALEDADLSQDARRYALQRQYVLGGQ
ncbi:tetratricopeptide repeat protein [Pseudidiomarina sp. 1APR75-33.1]|uniref:tetratricopeptide repeat protein n=1 Tax=Pseudidiomarina terrestris TaxID=2820060 RepID=UPI002651CBD8|nr:tetratricopeptide repeat protein [Pseudidiomarina sp. 1APR75-33.1]MDN7126270.1 tetratricopeptide repeat protein [Pseudidiomarina sp. 1APR75-33.1]